MKFSVSTLRLRDEEANNIEKLGHSMTKWSGSFLDNNKMCEVIEEAIHVHREITEYVEWLYLVNLILTIDSIQFSLVVCIAVFNYLLYQVAVIRKLILISLD